MPINEDFYSKSGTAQKMGAGTGQRVRRHYLFLPAALASDGISNLRGMLTKLWSVLSDFFPPGANSFRVSSRVNNHDIVVPVVIISCVVTETGLTIIMGRRAWAFGIVTAASREEQQTTCHRADYGLNHGISSVLMLD